MVLFAQQIPVDLMRTRVFTLHHLITNLSHQIDVTHKCYFASYSVVHICTPPARCWRQVAVWGTTECKQGQMVNLGHIDAGAYRGVK